MTYIAAADFRQLTIKPWCAGLVLSEADGTDAYLDLLIGLVTGRVEADLGDDFEPPNPDSDEVILLEWTGGWRLYVPRRVRSLTTVETQDSAGTYTATTAYRLRSSLNTAGTAMQDGRRQDWLEDWSGTGLWASGGTTVRLTGKFGWTAPPTDIKRLVALLVYDLAKSKADPLSNIAQRSTLDATIIYGEPREIVEISNRYRRRSEMALG